MRKRFLTLRQFVAAHPNFTESQLRYALRNRTDNGLAEAITKPRTGHAFMFDERRVHAWLTARVPA